ncbi:hypothetical protein EDC01DRAFT_777504 [Geopyxis carbonaria]|nr:hypothetical protein EDC01DRAFT_777504 [Geopyxis carbonaria]
MSKYRHQTPDIPSQLPPKTPSAPTPTATTARLHTATPSPHPPPSPLPTRHKRVKPGPTTDVQFQKEFVRKRMRIGESLRKSLQEAREEAGREEWSHSDPTRVVEVFFDVSLSELLSAAGGDGGSEMATPLEKALGDAKAYRRIDDDKVYIAYDRDLNVLVARFPDAFTVEDIAESITYFPPTAPRDDPRHTRYKEWIDAERNTVFTDGPWARCGQIHLGYKKYDYHIGLTEHMLMDERISWHICEFLKNTAKTIDLIFAATDPDLFQHFRRTFCRRTLAINLLAKPHKDTEYWRGGWAWHTVFGEFTGGDFCISLLKRRFAFAPGRVLGIRGAELEHFAEEWGGNCRNGVEDSNVKRTLERNQAVMV